MKPNTMKPNFVRLRLAAAGLLLASAITGSPITITVQSDASTLGATVAASGDPRLYSGNISGLSFSPVLVGAFGTFTQPPPGAPSGTQVINLPPGDGESGFFEVTFTLPAGFSGASLNGAGNVDDGGLAFLNGTIISPMLSEFGNVGFGTADNSLFNIGVNELVISDDNYGGGPSGAAFYATVNYITVPDRSAYMLPCFALVCLAMEIYRRRTLVRC
jgi:hypothetical protein